MLFITHHLLFIIHSRKIFAVDRGLPTADLLPFHQIGIVNVNALFPSEYADDDCQTDRHLGCGYCHYQEYYHLTIQIAPLSGKRHKSQIDRIEHQLNGHEHDQDISPDQYAQNTDDENHRT
jgi:hypothetical protein